MFLIQGFWWVAVVRKISLLSSHINSPRYDEMAFFYVHLLVVFLYA